MSAHPRPHHVRFRGYTGADVGRYQPPDRRGRKAISSDRPPRRGPGEHRQAPGRCRCAIEGKPGAPRRSSREHRGRSPTPALRSSRLSPSLGGVAPNRAALPPDASPRSELERVDLDVRYGVKGPRQTLERRSPLRTPIGREAGHIASGTCRRVRGGVPLAVLAWVAARERHDHSTCGGRAAIAARGPHGALPKNRAPAPASMARLPPTQTRNPWRWSTEGRARSQPRRPLGAPRPPALASRGNGRSLRAIRPPPNHGPGAASKDPVVGRAPSSVNTSGGRRRDRCLLRGRRDRGHWLGGGTRRGGARRCPRRGGRQSSGRRLRRWQICQHRRSLGRGNLPDAEQGLQGALGGLAHSAPPPQ